MENEEKKLISTRLTRSIDSFIAYLSNVVMWATFILVLCVVFQVVMRYIFGRGLLVLEEVEWHLYAVVIMMSMSYAMTENIHVRVDVFHRNFSPKTVIIVEILGLLFLFAPFVYAIFDQSIPYVMQSYKIHETSDSPSGLPYRYLIKAVIPASMFLLALAGFSRLIRAILTLLRSK